MRSRAEAVLRLMGVAAIVAWGALVLVPRAGGVIVVPQGALGGELERWTRDPSVTAVHVRVDTTPDAVTAAWLAALRGAGTTVSWSGSGLPAIAMETWASAEPAGGTVALVAADSGILGDALGPLDTLRGSSAVRLASFDGWLALSSGNHGVRVAGSREPRAQSRELKAIYLAGTANWESKFVIAALEEAGWRVDARLFVAPGQDVTQGARAPLDTSRHAAVVLLDSAAAQAVRGVEGFVRSGGGAVFAGSANAARRVAELAGWRAGARLAAPLGTMPGDTAWRGLSLTPLTIAPGRALALERRVGGAAIAARRHYAGRVAGVGYDETWRWRMAGGEHSVAQHGAWWSRLVAGVALRPVEARAVAMGAAPVAQLHDVLGEPAELSGPRARALPREALANLLGLMALASLLAEWFLRRARGAR